MVADRTKEGRDLVDFDHDNRRPAIRAPEIAQIAAFKVRDCAARLETLASVGLESALRNELRDVVTELRRMEVALLRHVHGEGRKPG